MFLSQFAATDNSIFSSTNFMDSTGNYLFLPLLIAFLVFSFLFVFFVAQIMLVFKLLSMTDRIKNIDKNMQLLASKAADSNSSRYPQYGRNPRNDVQLPPDATQE